MAAAKKPNVAVLDSHADLVRSALPPTKQSEVFKLATEAGYLTALADGTEDLAERESLIAAIEVLSKGLVLEWEIEELLAEAWGRIQAEGNDARATKIGQELHALGAAEAGLLIAAIVAHTTSGIDKREAAVLEKIGKGAGLVKQDIAGIVKKAR